MYSTFTADELGMDSMEWTMVSLAAHGIRPAESAPVVGYSERTIRRKLNHFSRFGPAGHFEWIQLAPLFPSDGSQP
ncbi:MAG: helix-turn-helix domain-containing protein [Nitrospiraceae bacterium]|nr:helix-turn-helix domain-containing protein [Nitrospiraceae bacterium]